MSGLIITTIGGGSSYTPELIDGFIKRYNSLPIKEIRLVDIEEGAEKLEIVGNLAKRMIEKAALPIKLTTTIDREKALYGSDFVTTQLRVGQLKARESDEKIPLKYKMLGQETNGAGGMFKALRTIPVILDISKDIKRLCPNAWFINFSNPAGMVTEACLRYGHTKKVIGLCNVPVHMERDIANLLEVDSKRIWIKFAGLNHMVFAVNIYLDGKDVTKYVLELSTAENSKAITMKNIMPVNYEADFIKGLGVLPCPYHSYYFRKDQQLEEELKQLESGTVRSSEVQKIEKELFEIYKDTNLNIKPPQLEKRGGAYYSDAACSLIDSIYNDKKDIQTVDTKNNGAIHGIDENSVVEVSSVITKEGPIPLTIGRLPISVNGLVQQIKSFEMLTIEAAVTGDYQKALAALTINPLTQSDKTAKKVLDELLEIHKDYLPNFNNKRCYHDL